jgi:WD40 repeat protein
MKQKQASLVLLIEYVMHYHMFDSVHQSEDVPTSCYSVCYYTQTVRIWDIASGACVGIIHAGHSCASAVTAVSFDQVIYIVVTFL